MEYIMTLSDGEEKDVHFFLLASVTNYSVSEETFYSYFTKLPKEVKSHIEYLSTTNDFEDTEFEDVEELAREVWGYYTSYKKKLKKLKAAKNSLFTLRNSEDLVIFEEFLDKMIKLRNLSEKHFVMLFPRCPPIFWDKIDDLRETSHKKDRDSEEYTRCLEKCKVLSYDFSELSGTSTSNYE